MSLMSLTPTCMREGVWHGVLKYSGEGIPKVRVTHRDRAISDVFVTEAEGNTWNLKIPIPAVAIADGVQTFLISDANDGTRLGQFTLIAGDSLGEDIRAEVTLLREELDMLKRAFRRHCVETG